MSTLEERLQGGSSQPWIADAAKAAKWRSEGRDCYSEQVVVGKAIDHFTRTNFNGDGVYDVVVLEVEGVGEVAIHCGPTVLANQMTAARPKPGERVGVAYKGLVQRAGQPDYHAYVVKVERELGGDFAWADGGHEETFQPEAKPEPAAAPSFPSAGQNVGGAVGGGDFDDGSGIPFAASIF